MAVDFSHTYYDSAEHARRYPRVRRSMPREEWDAVYEQVAAIQALKDRHGAMVLAHNYQRPEIFHGVADVQGDSLALARIAAESDANVFVMCGMHFMAETVKLLAPDRLVLLRTLMRDVRWPNRFRPPMCGRCALAIQACRPFVT